MNDKKQPKKCMGCSAYYFGKCRVVECLRKELPEPVPA